MCDRMKDNSSTARYEYDREQQQQQQNMRQTRQSSMKKENLQPSDYAAVCAQNTT